MCFVIAPIGESGSETRKRSDQILKHVIEPSTTECGYEAVRADRISEPGLITAQVITHILEAPLVLADLSEHNPNVFYELAIRHAIGRPLVQIIRASERIPFDVAGMRTIPVDHHDLDSVAEARQELVRQIKAVEKDPARVHSPISTAINLQNLRSSERPVEQLLGEMNAAILQLRSSITHIDRRVSALAPNLQASTARNSPRRHFIDFDRPVTYNMYNPPNFLDPNRYQYRTHQMYPEFEGAGDGTVTIRTCCDMFMRELVEALDVAEPGTSGGNA
jgi:hypothetical protein